MEDESIIKKIMPHSPEAEQSVLGAMLIDENAIDTAGELLSGEDFYSRANGLLFDAMKELHNAGKPADSVTLLEKLRQKGAPEEIVGRDFIKQILDAVPTSANVKHYAQIVYEKSMIRRLIKVTEDVTKACYSGAESMDELCEDAEKQIFGLLQSRNTKEYVPIAEIVMDVLRQIETASKSKDYLTGLSTGFKDLDIKTLGMQKSDFILIAARPSMGKTAFALTLAQHCAVKKGMGVAIFSLEMSKEQLVNRLLSMESRIDAQTIRSGDLSDAQWDELMQSSEVLAGTNIIIDDTPGISVSEMRSKCRKYKLEHDIQLVIVDYIQLMSAGRRVESRQQELTDISRSLKSLARELEVPIVVISQLNRSVDTRAGGHRPVLSDIRESGAIEQDADVVMFLYRDDYYNADSEEKNVAEVIIAKQRNGPTGTVKLTWQPKYTRFANRLTE